MKTRLASMFLLLVLFGSAFAGVPLGSGESNCAISGMMDMECCKAMLLLQSRTKFTHEDELLCALNCARNSTTLPSSVVRVAPPAKSVSHPHLSLIQPPANPRLFARGAKVHSPPGSPPTYLRNLTLLI